MTDDFTSDDNDKRGRNTNKNKVAKNTNTDNQNANYGKWKLLPPVASSAWKTAFRSWAMFSPVDLTFLARQEWESDNCKSSDKLKVFKMHFIVCLLNCVIVQINFVLWLWAIHKEIITQDV